MFSLFKDTLLMDTLNMQRIYIKLISKDLWDSLEPHEQKAQLEKFTKDSAKTIKKALKEYKATCATEMHYNVQLITNEEYIEDELVKILELNGFGY
jgi:TRAP-type C4-dicarboxylate transport system substrate-binding protein